MRIKNEDKLSLSDVLLCPKRSYLNSRKEVDLNRAFTFCNSKKKWLGIPIMASNMDGIGTFEIHWALNKFKMFTCLHKHYSEDELVNFFIDPRTDSDLVSFSIGIVQQDIDKYLAVKNKLPADTIKFVTIDVANGYTERFLSFVSKFRNKNPDVTLIAGNVVTGEITEQLILDGVDIVKIGIGPGSVCTTRIQTGVGYPQLSAIIETADAAHGLGGLVIGDGGCTCPGDIAKAFAGGSDFVMLGSLLAGHAEGNAKILEKWIKTDKLQDIKQDKEGNLISAKPVYVKKKFIHFYGMSSEAAMFLHSGGTSNYRSAEGRIVELPYKGNVEVTLRSILGGLRSTCTYLGARRLKELAKRTTFVKTVQQYNTSLLSSSL